MRNLSGVSVVVFFVCVVLAATMLALAPANGMNFITQSGGRLWDGGAGSINVTVTFVNITNNGDPINGWHDNPSPNGIDFGTGGLWIGWDSTLYGLPGPGKCALMNDNSTHVVRTIYLPAGKVFKKVDLGKCAASALGTITFSSTGNPDRVVQIADCPMTNYELNWSNPSESVTITVDITNGYCVGSVIGFDNFVFGDVGGGGQEFKFTGYNFYELFLLNGEGRRLTEAELRDLVDNVYIAGGKVIRIFSVYECYSGIGTLDPIDCAQLDLFIKICHDRGIRVVLCLIDQAMDIYFPASVHWFEDWSGAPANSFYSDLTVRANYKNTISQLINRWNTHYDPAIQYKDDPTILCWETGSELGTYYNYSSVPEVDIDNWTDDIAAFIKGQDSNHLVMDGHVNDDLGYWWVCNHSWTAGNNIDIVDLHLYYEYLYKWPGFNLWEICRDLTLAGRTNNKAFVAAEFGQGDRYEPQIRELLDAVINYETPGIILWVASGHDLYTENGGFTTGWQFLLPGMPYMQLYGDPSFDQIDVLDHRASPYSRGLVHTAYAQDGLPVPTVASWFGDLSAPTFVSGCNYNSLTWKGVSGARTYHLQRYETAWEYIGGELDDSVPWRPFYNDVTALPGHTYWYRVTGVDRDGHESANWSSAIGPFTADVTVTFINIVNNGDYIYGWHDNPSPNGIDFGSGYPWLGWDSTLYGLPGPGKCALMNDNATHVVRTIYLPTGKKLKKVDLGKCAPPALGTITFHSSGSGNPDRIVQIADCPMTGYQLNWSNPSDSVTITVDITNGYCVGSVIGFDNFVFGN